MFPVEQIISFDAPELQPYRTMRRQEEQRKQGIFVAEGEKVVQRLLESSLDIVSVLLPSQWIEAWRSLLDRRAGHLKVFCAEKQLLETLTGFSMYQGLLAVGKVPKEPSLSDVLGQSPQPKLFVATDSLTSSQNMGALVRNCAALGAQALIVGETCCSPWIRRAVRSSMGTVFQLPVIESNSLVSTLAELKRAGVKSLAAHPHIEGRTVTGLDFNASTCVVLGSEGHGISAAILDMCDAAAAIPMAPGVDSLNVATAAAVFLFEANRQRGKMN
jgi:tRNA G18 (ribose-2'-O)-methylase SpoU